MSAAAMSSPKKKDIVIFFGTRSRFAMLELFIFGFEWVQAAQYETHGIKPSGTSCFVYNKLP